MKILTLPQLAARINELGQAAADAHLEFCRALAEAEVRVHGELKVTFQEWAAKNLRRPNGRPWSWETLKTYVKFGKNPDYLMRHRDYVKNYRRESAIARKLAKPEITNVADEVNLLMTAWERASDRARAQFLGFINARLLPERTIPTRMRAVRRLVGATGSANGRARCRLSKGNSP